MTLWSVRTLVAHFFFDSVVEWCAASVVVKLLWEWPISGVSPSSPAELPPPVDTMDGACTGGERWPLSPGGISSWLALCAWRGLLRLLGQESGFGRHPGGNICVPVEGSLGSRSETIWLLPQRSTWALGKCRSFKVLRRPSLSSMFSFKRVFVCPFVDLEIFCYVR